MDTSPKYIEMCKKAIEIQEQWKPDVADFVMGEYESTITIWQTVQGIDHGSLKPLFTNAGKLAWYLKSEMIWLPRQDQLQELTHAKKHGGALFGELIKFIEWFEKTYIEMSNMDKPNRTFFNTQEQLWLAFVMKEKYGEKWIDNDWRKVYE